MNYDIDDQSFECNECEAMNVEELHVSPEMFMDEDELATLVLQDEQELSDLFSRQSRNFERDSLEWSDVLW